MGTEIPILKMQDHHATRGMHGLLKIQGVRQDFRHYQCKAEGRGKMTANRC